MSRSYKKNPWCKDYNRGSKTLANRTIRHGKKTKDIPNGRAYQKYTCSWDICDYKSYMPHEEWRLNQESKTKHNINCGQHQYRYMYIEHHWRQCFRMK